MIIVGIREGLGNQMFQYAFARALQEKTKRPVKIETKVSSRMEKKSYKQRQYELDRFKITLEEMDLRKEANYRFLFQDTLFSKIASFLSKRRIYPYKYYNLIYKYYKEKYLNIKGNCIIQGCFQDERYFYNIRKILLEEFQPKNEIGLTESIEEILKYDELVSLHIRRGDYQDYNNVLPLAYYRKAIKYMKTRCEKPIFLVFSDDVSWVQEKLGKSDDVQYLCDYVHLQDYEELWVMSMCKHNIISNSTFSWWAAWLNRNPEKLVVAPQKWFQMQRDIVPHEWTVI